MRALRAPPPLCLLAQMLLDDATQLPDLLSLSLALIPSSASSLLSVRGRRDYRRAPPRPQPSPCPSDVTSSSTVDPYAVSTEPRDEKSLGAPPRRLLPSRVTEIASDRASAPTRPRARWPSPPLFAFAGQRNLDHVETAALVANQNGTVTTTVFNVRTAIMKRLGLSNLDIAGLSFIDTDTQAVLTYDGVNDTLTLPLNFEGATIIVSLNTDSTDTGRYGVTNLTLDMTRRVVADVAIPSNLVDEGMSDYLAIIGADKDENVAGYVGQTVTVDVPKVPGWVADKSTIQATVNANGTITAIEAVIYSPDTNPHTGHDQPTDPTDPTGPTGPTGPTTPTDPTNPTGPTEPADPVSPADPSEPTTPVNPTTPTTGDSVTPMAPIVDDHKAALIQPAVKSGVDTRWTYRHDASTKRMGHPSQSSEPQRIVSGRFEQTGQADRATFTNNMVKTGHQQAVTATGPSSAERRLPQTNDHPTGWQWLGWALLTMLGWLGFSKKKRRQ